MPQFSLSVEEFLALPDPPTLWAVDGLLPVGGSMLIFGDPKVGKSFVALQLAHALSTGSSWLHWNCQPQRVLYIQLDTPRSLWKLRLRRLMEAGELPQTQFRLADRECWDTWPFNIANTAHADLLHTAVQEFDAEVVILDVFKEATQAPENDNTEGHRALSGLISACQPASLILLHHARKEGERGNTLISGARGGGYLTAKMDAIVYLTSKQIEWTGRETEGGKARMTRTKDGLWLPHIDSPAHHDLIQQIIHEPGSVRERARQLAQFMGWSEEAARSAIRRALEAADPPAGPGAPTASSPTATA